MNKLFIKKALAINKNKKIYGSFAEIGAGQGVVQYFFRAGLASQTIAKSISAYDMVFSDEIYGKQNRYVCKKRLIDMLSHEYQLLQKRLNKIKNKKCFFSFATTASTRSNEKKQNAWLGIRFQTKPMSPYNEIHFHIKPLDKKRLNQHQLIGMLGVNLIHTCYTSKLDHQRKFLLSLTNMIKQSKVEISSFSSSGSNLKKFDNLALNLNLIDIHFSKSCIINSQKKVSIISDVLYEKNIIVLNDKQDVRTLRKEYPNYLKQKDNLVLLTVKFKKILLKNNLKYFSEIPVINTKNFYSLIHKYKNKTELKKFLKTHTEQKIIFL